VGHLEGAQNVISARDFEYIEGRLLAPCWPLSEAIERLEQLGFAEQVEHLLASQRGLNEACRVVRAELRAERLRPPREQVRP
jgi:hypothetical protein